MNKPALKRFATSLRVRLIELVKAKVDYFLALDELPIEYKEHELSIKKIKQICENGKYTDFIEEVAYIWFNRLIAFRFMDVNDITSSKVISPLANNTQPQIFSDALGGDIDEDLHVNKKKLYNLIDGKIDAKDKDNEAYRLLFIASCNRYYDILPFMFEQIADFTELLLPNDLLSSNSIRAKVVEAMSEEDCKDIEVIGWLYQFYISQKKDEVFEGLRKNKKITPSNIPAATQLFTPHWIVRYLVENSLGKIWMQNRPNSTLKDFMTYYIDEPTEEYVKISSPQELTIFDPCCGSGHMLTYAFDLLTRIYEEEGYSKSQIPSLILEHNIFGCDIDKRAASLANFALMMKARLYHRRFFKKSTPANILELKEFGSEEFKDIKNLGSLIKPKELDEDNKGIFSTPSKEFALQHKMLSQTYTCTVTNPPYMGAKGMNKELSDFVKQNYKDSKSDLFAVFMERCLEFTCKDGYMAMINQHSWMFLSSYEKLRQKIIQNHKIDTLVHLGVRAFEEIGGEVVQSVAFVLKKEKIEN